MRLGTKSVVIVVLAMVALVGALHAFATRFIMPRSPRSRQSAHRELGLHAREVLAFEQRQFGESGDDWATWNDLILYAREPNEAWEAENLTPLSYKMKSWTDSDDRSR